MPRGSAHVRAAAVVEAKALGHTELGVGHLLLGLRTVAGPSAHALASAGVGLAELRDAVARSTPLASGGTPPPVRRAVRAADRIAAHAVPVAPRVRDLLDGVAFRRDDADLLGLLLDDEEDPFPAHLLRSVGVDPGEVARRLAVLRRPGALDVAGPRPAPAQPAEPGTVWLTEVHTHLLTAPPERVWALLSDPHRRPEWDHACERVDVTGSGVHRIVEPDGSTVENVVASRVPERVIAWRWPGSHRSTRHPWTGELRMRMQPDRDRTALEASMVLRGRWLVARLGRPVFTRVMRARLTLLAQGVDQAAG